MNRRDFLRMLSMMPLLKFPNFLGGIPKSVDCGTASVLDDVEGFMGSDTSPHPMYKSRVDVDYVTPLNGHWDYAWTDANLNGEAGWVGLDVQHLPTGQDMLWMRHPEGDVCVSEVPPSGDYVVSWWVESRRRHTVYCEHVPLFEVPADGQTHFVAIAWEKGHPVKAYLDSDAVWFSDVKIDEEGVQSQWGYIW